MRITNNMLVNNMMNNIGNNLGRMDKYQNQLASGKKIQVPSDDPIVASRALKLRTDVSEIDQYQRNLKDAQSWMDITESTLSNIGDVLTRVRELSVQGSNGTNTPDDTQKIGQEMTQLKNQLIHLSNATYAGRYIFSGYNTDKKLIIDDPADPNYGNFNINVSNSDAIKYEIGIGDNININVLGSDLFNGGAAVASPPAPSAQTGTMVDNLTKIISYLNSGDSASVGNMLTKIDDDVNNLLKIRADVGARANRVELTSNRLENDNVNFTKLMSDNEDVDMAETIMNLQNEENVYKASLAGGAKIIQPTLVDFLR